MAFQRNTSSNTMIQQDDSWKATAFINLYVPGVGGEGRRKIGSISLKDSRAFDKKLIERLQQDGGLEAMANVLEVDFRMAESEAPDLGF